MVVAPSITWLFVRTIPSDARIMPVPSAISCWKDSRVSTSTMAGSTRAAMTEGDTPSGRLTTGGTDAGGGTVSGLTGAPPDPLAARAVVGGVAPRGVDPSDRAGPVVVVVGDPGAGGPALVEVGRVVTTTPTPPATSTARMSTSSTANV